ncbi:MAG: CAF17-like 4Fe-4S cluster assembly/insertion protein YgfZ, partial [Devosia sp.]
EGLSGWAEGAFWLDVHESVADSFFKRMRMYKLRAALEIEDLRESFAVGWSDAKAGGTVHADPRAGGLGSRMIARRAEASGWATDDREFVRRRIVAGVAELGPDFAPDTTFPHDIGMDFLHGVDFTKGCYVGQEVVSRMQHRGTARRRPVIVSGVEAAAGGPVMVSGREVGDIGQVMDGKAVAILRLDRIEEPASATVDGKPVALTLPEWATYGFGEAA